MDCIASGEVAAYVHSIEFQKRGLLYAQISVFVKDKMNTAERIDKTLSAEIPDPLQIIDMHDRVMIYMTHGPCGIKYPSDPRMENNACCMN